MIKLDIPSPPITYIYLLFNCSYYFQLDNIVRNCICHNCNDFIQSISAIKFFCIHNSFNALLPGSIGASVFATVHEHDPLISPKTSGDRVLYLKLCVNFLPLNSLSCIKNFGDFHACFLTNPASS